MTKKSASGRKIKIGIDLDGVIIGKPFFMPKRLLEWLYCSHGNRQKKYRFPELKVEIWLRKLSHHPLLRPPLGKNLEAIKKLAKKKNVEIYIISGRYSFLKKRTQVWLEKNEINQLFQKIIINQQNQQPHIFKKEMVQKLKLDYFFDDDPIIINYLKEKIKGTKLFLVKNENLNFSHLLSS